MSEKNDRPVRLRLSTIERIDVWANRGPTFKASYDEVINMMLDIVEKKEHGKNNPNSNK